MSAMKSGFVRLVAYRSRPSRWWYLPFLLVEGGLGFLILSGEYRDPSGWTHLAVVLVLLAQTIRPTALGWGAAMVAWFASEFLQPLYDRLAFHIPGFTITFLLLWGLAPLVLLWLIRPRLAGAPPGTDRANR